MAFERRPSSWAVRWMSSQLWASALCSQMLIANFGMKDFSAAAGQAAEAGVDQFAEDVADAALGEVREPIDFDGGPGLEVQRGIGVVQEADDVQVPIELHLVVQAADDVHFGAARVDGFLAASENLLVAHAGSLWCSRRSERNAQKMQR